MKKGYRCVIWLKSGNLLRKYEHLVYWFMSDLCHKIKFWFCLFCLYKCSRWLITVLGTPWQISYHQTSLQTQSFWLLLGSHHLGILAPIVFRQSISTAATLPFFADNCTPELFKDADTVFTNLFLRSSVKGLYSEYSQVTCMWVNKPFKTNSLQYSYPGKLLGTFLCSNGSQLEWVLLPHETFDSA